jgi:hypothetical protein
MGGIPHARGEVLGIFIYSPLHMGYPQVVSVDKYLSPTIRRWISCGHKQNNIL